MTLHPGDDESDAELVRRACDRDEAAIDALFQRHRERLVAIAYRAFAEGKRRAVSQQDVVQDALLDAFRGLGHFHGDAKFSTWLAAVLINCVHKERRRQRAQKRGAAQQDWIPADEWDGIAQAGRLTPGAAMVAQENQEEVRAAIESLSPTLRAVMRLLYIEGLPLPDVATRLGITLGAARKRHERAFEILERKLGGAPGSG